MWSQAEKTEPLSLVHPRSANVTVLSEDPGLEVTAITSGTLHFRFTDRPEPFASVCLRVDGSFVTLTVPRVLGTEHLRDALRAALPQGYLALAHPSDEALVVTIARAAEVEPTPHLFCTSLDTTMRARKVGTNRMLIKGVARGRGDIVVRLDDRELKVLPTRGETPMAIALRLRALLEPTHIALLTVPSQPGGDVVLTVLPRT